MLILGIESSCDETGLALYSTQTGLLSHALYSQIDMHQAYADVLSKLTSRDPVRWVLPLLLQVLQKAQIEKSAIDVIAYTEGSGLTGALLVGASIAYRVIRVGSDP